MIDLLINAAKLALSKDARETATGLVDLIRNHPSWQKDICTLEATVTASAREQAYLLGGLTTDKMRNLGYSQDSITAFEYVYRELTSNAFEHGCTPHPEGPIGVLIETTAHYVSATIRNPPGSTFSLPRFLDVQQLKLGNDPTALRGRGLVISAEFADSISQTEDREGLKALIYKPSVSLKLNMLAEDVAVIHVLDGFGNPSVNRRLRALASQAAACHVILDLSALAAHRDESKDLKEAITTSGLAGGPAIPGSGRTRPHFGRAMPSSTLISGSLQLAKAKLGIVFEHGSRRLVMLLPPIPGFPNHIIDPSVRAASPAQAVEMLGRPELAKPLVQLIQDASGAN